MADKPQMSFSDYIRRGGTSVAPPPLPKPGKIEGFELPKGSSGNPQDPLSWLIDIISRPLYSVTERFDTALDSIEDASRVQEKFKSGDVLGGIGDSLGTSAKNTLSPLRGFFSTDESDKSLTSQLIEKGTDVAGKKFNPSYVDEQDNVNPVLKGILGFAGDVGLDPLTYLGGAILTAPFKAGFRALKGGAKAVGAGAKTAADAVRAAKSPLEDVLSTASSKIEEATLSKTPGVDIVKSISEDAPIITPRADEPYEVIMHNRSSSRIEKFSSKEEAEAFAETLRTKHNWSATTSSNSRQVGKYQIVPGVREASKAAENAAPKAPMSLGEAMRSSAQHSEAKSFLDELSKAPPKSPKASLKEVITGEKLGEMAWIQSFVKNALNHPNATAPHSGGFRVPISEIMDNPRLLEDSKVMSFMREGYKRYLSGQIDEVGMSVPKGRKKALPKANAKVKQEDLSTARARFRKKVSTADGIAEVERVLGVGLTGYLKNPNLGATRFEETIDKLRSMLDDTGTLDNFDLEKVGSPFNKLLKQLGIKTPPTMQREHVAYTRSSSKVGPEVTPDGMVDTIRKMGEEADPVLQVAREDVAAILPGVLERNLRDVGPEHGYGYISDSGTLRTDDIATVGKGRNQYQVNTYTQAEIATKLEERISKRLEETRKLGKKLSGPERAKEFETQFRASYGEMVRLLDDYGVPVHIDETFNNRQPVQLPLNFNEVYDAIAMASVEGQKLIRMVRFNTPTYVPPTRIMESVTRMLSGEDMIVPLVAKGSRYNADSEVTNFLSESNRGVYGHQAVSNNQNWEKWVAPAGAEFRANLVKSGKKKGSVQGLWIDYKSNEVLPMLVEAIRKAQPDLEAMVVRNKSAYDKRYGAEVFDMTGKVFGDLMRLIEDPANVAEAMTRLVNSGKAVREVAREGKVLPQSAATTAAIVATETAELAKRAKSAEAISAGAAVGGKKGAAKGSKEGQAASEKAFKETVREADDEVAAIKVEDAINNPEGLTGALRAVTDDVVEEVDASMKWFGLINSGILKTLDPVSRAFRADHGMGGKLDFYRLKHSAGVLHKTLLAKKVVGLRQLSVRYGKPIKGTSVAPLVQAFHAFQKGVAPNSNPQVAEAYREISSYMGDLFGVSNGSIFGNVFFRNNTGVDYINEMFSRYSILGKDVQPKNGVFFDLDEAEHLVKATAASGNQIDILTAAENQWRNWPMPDTPQGITEFMSKLHTASIRMATDVAVRDAFVNMVMTTGLGARTATKGMVKLIDSKGSTSVVRLLPDDLYVDKEIANAFHRVDEVMGASQRIDGEVGKFIHNYFDPTQNAWKVAITIYRPGHHFRNHFGDESMTFMAEGLMGWHKATKDAFKVMSLRNTYEGVDIMKALSHLGVDDIPTSGQVISSGKFSNGKKFEMTNEGIYHAMMKEGVLPPAHITEDVYIDDALATGAANLKKFMGAITFKGKALEKAASGVSEYRDHYSRIKHFIQYVDNHAGEFDNLDDLLSSAGTVIKKWHPDVSLLSTAEAKYMRRVMPFYSWFRGAIPAVASAIVMNPARVNAFNKASYNLSVSMGVNPDSLADPFPIDQLFPSFLTEQMSGPQFKLADGTYMRVNPGFASWDVLNMLGSAPTVSEGVVRGVAGSVSPLIRMPAEMMAGGSWGTGARINDMSDYLDSSIPGVNYLSNVTGTSVTGSLLGGKVDPQFQHAKGNKDVDDQVLSLLNYVSGVGLQDFSKPNYINFAEIEKRNREGNQSGF